MTGTMFKKVLVLQNGFSHGHLSISFLNNFLWLLPKIEQKRISLNNNIVRCKNSSVIKYLSNSGSFFLFSVSKHFFILSSFYSKFHVFLKNIPHKKNP